MARSTAKRQLLRPAQKPTDELNAREYSHGSSYPLPNVGPVWSTARFGLHMLWPDAKAKDERWQFAYQRPAQETGEAKGTLGVDGSFEQAILHEIDDGLYHSCGPFASSLHTGEIGNGHLPGLKRRGENIGRCYSIHDSIVNAIATSW